jgi:hypothetical protein
MNTNRKTRKQRNYVNKTRKIHLYIAPKPSFQERLKKLRDKQDTENQKSNEPHIETARERFYRMRKEARQELGLPEETDEERLSNFHRRMLMPMGISRGFPITDEMRQIVEETKRMFNL